MRSMSFVRVCLSALLATLLLTAATAFAKDGRDFFGLYNVSGVREQGDFMRVTLNLQVNNYSAADVKDAVISLRQNTGLVTVGESKPIRLLRDHGSVRVHQRFIVSRNEYELWGQGSQPTVFMVYRDARGRRLERYIQLAPGHGF